MKIFLSFFILLLFAACAPATRTQELVYMAQPEQLASSLYRAVLDTPVPQGQGFVLFEVVPSREEGVLLARYYGRDGFEQNVRFKLEPQGEGTVRIRATTSATGGTSALAERFVGLVLRGLDGNFYRIRT